ncbi:MAG: hypothetical protein JRJ27_10870, partial [Deltaproteobacteria bacterium]|nr:hypothetical protein [Deltaproteobacteria bacterium]
MSKTPSIFEGTPFSQLVWRKIILIITILILFFLQSGCSSSKDKTGIEKPVAVEIKEIQTIDLPVDVET